MNTRPLRPGDDRDIERIFAETIASGRPLPFAFGDAEEYAALCLDWYLGPGRDDAVVLEDQGRVVGYALVCVDEDAHRRWARCVGAAWVLRAVAVLVARSDSEEARRFLRLRLHDGWVTLLGPAPPCRAHLHLNVLAGHRGGRSGRLLVAAAEERFRRAGVGEWYGEMNAPIGRRGAALERSGARIVHRQPNRTLSWLAGRPVERLRFVRQVGPPPGGPGAQNRPERRRARHAGPEPEAVTVSTRG